VVNGLLIRQAERKLAATVALSARAQVGGVLEPVDAIKVIVEDEVMVGGNCGIYEGRIIKRSAVLCTGTLLNRSTPVYDPVKSLMYSGDPGEPLIIPEHAVVSAGIAANFKRPRKGLGTISLHCNHRQVRDASTDARVELEDLLR
jgi:2,3,4,5-tetrahydropyridine-2,6-dicarboxylate N-succinyltransferase